MQQTTVGKTGCGTCGVNSNWHGCCPQKQGHAAVVALLTAVQLYLPLAEQLHHDSSHIQQTMQC